MEKRFVAPESARRTVRAAKERTGLASVRNLILLGVLLAAGAKGKRLALPNAEIMIHQPSGGTQGQASDIKIQAEWMLRTREKLNRILSECTGKSIEQVAVDTERDNFMPAEEALAYGLIDKVIYKR